MLGNTPGSGIVTMTVGVVEELLGEVEEVLELTEPDRARRKLLGIRMSLRSLRDEAKGEDDE